MTCEANVCGTGGWSGPKPGDPDNNSVLSATPAFGGIDVSWTYPSTNPFAVAHTVIYRGVSANFQGAIYLATEGGNFFYDKTDIAQPIEYFYWIRLVSINGTYGELIGPASAVARPTIERTIELLTGKIESGALAQSLKTEIAKITLNYQELTSEIAKRVQGNAALSQALQDVQNGIEESLSFVHAEVIARMEGQNALATQLNTVAAVNTQNAAAILEERTARVTADSAMSTQVSNVAAATKTAAAAVLTETNARTTADTALASQITTAQSTLNGNIASVQTSLQTNINAVTGTVNSMYTAKVTVNDLIGGFGLSNNGKTVEAGFDVDRFWVGRTGANKRKPFIIENDEVFMDQAVIKSLTFSKLRDESGSFIVENGKIKANYLHVMEITGGAFTGYAWPDKNAGGGFYLGPGGLLLGNANKYFNGGGGGFFQVDEIGDVRSPSFDVTKGVMTVKQANVINTLNIAGNAVTVPKVDFRTTWVTGGSGNVVLADIWLTLDQPGWVYAVFTAQQSYGSGMRDSMTYLSLAGQTVPVGGAAVTTNIAVSLARYLPAGGHSIQVSWTGQDSGVSVGNTSLFVMGVMR